MTLTEYLHELAGERVRYGQLDCLLAVADWVRELTGHDEGARYRGTYSDEAGWRAVVDRAGGMVALVDEACARIGLQRVGAALAGDVGVVDLPGPGHAGAICAGPRWVFFVEGGLAGLAVPAARVATAWGRR